MTRTQKSLKTDMPIIVAPFKRVENFVMRRKKQRRAHQSVRPLVNSAADPANGEESKHQDPNLKLATSKIHRLNYNFGAQSPPTHLEQMGSSAFSASQQV